MGLFVVKRAPPPVVPLRFVDELYPEYHTDTAGRKNGRLDYHLPAEFSKERPLFLFSVDKQNMSIDDHPVLAKIPKANGERPMAFKEPSAWFRPHTRSHTTPEAFDDWLYNDIPQLSIHVVNFEDATVITVTLLHTLTDFLGLMAFYRAWLQQLHGQEDQIAPYIGYKDKDPLGNLQQGKKPPKYIYADRVVKGWDLVKFVMRQLWDRFWYPQASLLANSVRESIQIHRSVEQLQAQDAAFRESKAKTGRLPLYGDSDMLLQVVTNCYRGRLFQLDFSPAVITPVGEGQTSKKCLPVFLSCTGMETKWAARNGIAILGKTDNGDWWLSSCLRHDVWDKIEEEFEKL
ncbi:hypothetical protein GGR57DRAFT_516703 [Xylariaceae sp. FL1272]|nr:hypothetical protein GGR57DRAFT_516703 [Xylariaceae sp. FL1272]